MLAFGVVAWPVWALLGVLGLRHSSVAATILVVLVMTGLAYLRDKRDGLL